MRRALDPLAALLIGLLGAAVLAGCQGESPRPPQTTGREIPDVRLHRVEFTEVKDGRRHWHLRAAGIDYERAGGLGRLRQVEVTFYADRGQPLVVTSERGTFDSQAKEIELAGDVRGYAPPYRFFSDSLRYLPRERVLTAKGPARLESATLKVGGTGLRYGLAERRFEIGQDVKATSEQHVF